LVVWLAVENWSILVTTTATGTKAI